MFSRASALFVVSLLSVFAVATPAAEITARQSDECNTGSIQCCNSVQNANSSEVSTLAGLLGVVLGDITGQVGVGCTPISVIGSGTGAECDQEPVCCSGNSYSGVIVVGCSPINIDL